MKVTGTEMEYKQFKMEREEKKRGHNKKEV